MILANLSSAKPAQCSVALIYLPLSMWIVSVLKRPRCLNSPLHGRSRQSVHGGCPGRLPHSCSLVTTALRRVLGHGTALDSPPRILLLSLGDLLITLAHVRGPLRFIWRMANGHADPDLQSTLVSACHRRRCIQFFGGWGLTSVSKGPFELSTRSSSNFILPGSNNTRSVLPPNLK